MGALFELPEHTELNNVECVCLFVCVLITNESEEYRIILKTVKKKYIIRLFAYYTERSLFLTLFVKIISHMIMIFFSTGSVFSL